MGTGLKIVRPDQQVRFYGLQEGPSHESCRKITHGKAERDKKSRLKQHGSTRKNRKTNQSGLVIDDVQKC